MTVLLRIGAGILCGVSAIVCVLVGAMLAVILILAIPFILVALLAIFTMLVSLSYASGGSVARMLQGL